MRPVLEYTLLRILLLVAVGGFAYAVGMRGLLLLAAAFVGSGVLSYVVLRSQRDRLGLQVGGVFRRINERIDKAAASEDEAAAQDQVTGNELAAEQEVAAPDGATQVTEPEADLRPQRRNAAR